MSADLDMYDRLDDAEGWETRDSGYMLLVDMAPGHRQGLLRWLYERAGVLKFQHDLAMTTCPYPSGEQASWLFEEEFARSLHQTARDWIEDTPLVDALMELVARDLNANVDRIHDVA